MLLVFTTCPGHDEAESLARRIVEAKLAACVQVLPEIKSFYSWEGEVQSESENLLLIKSLPDRYNDLERFIIENHSYDVPEIVALAASHVSGSYLKWAKESL
jgi:periplasmic divalent cation tolerance protein